MIDEWDYRGHTPAPWTVRRGRADTVLVESNSWGCSDCGNTNIYSYENTKGKEICFPESVEPDPFIMPEQTDRGRPMCYCESCDMMAYADKVDATQNDNDLALIADAPLILEAFVDEQAEVERLRKQLVAHTDFVLWVEEKHNEVFDEYERKDEL